MLRCTALALLLHTSAADAQTYWLKISTKTLSQTRVQVTLQTDIPDGAWLGARFIHSQQKPNDPALGVRLERQKVKAGKATFELDMDKSTSTMPSGKWRVNVFYSPLWEGNQAFNDKYRVPYLEQSNELYLKGHGIDYKYWLSARARGHKFFTRNSGIKSFEPFLRPWNLNQMSKKYGSYIKLTPNKPDAETAAVYYFPYLDMQFAIDKKGQLINMVSGRALTSK